MSDIHYVEIKARKHYLVERLKDDTSQRGIILINSSILTLNHRKHLIKIEIHTSSDLRDGLCTVKSKKVYTEKS